MPRGKGKRCHGFLSGDGLFAHCSRQEYAGNLKPDPNGQTYPHRLDGSCECGKNHGPVFPASTVKPTGEKPIQTKAYPYQDEKGNLLFEVCRFKPKGFKQRRPDGYQYTQFCERYRRWKGSLDPCMRQEHKAGEKLFVDYCGQTVPVIDRTTGEAKEAQIFVAALGASNYTYAEATWTQQLPDWIGAHVRALNFFGGCPEVLIPDNLRSGVSQACRYEPDLNPTYQAFAAHYGIAVIPTRVRKPQDKAKVEKSVQLVENWILARLRNQTFFSLSELNQAMGACLQELNDRPFQKLNGTRRSLFESVERPALQPLPATPFELAEWKQVTVGNDYHVELDRHYYSVPHAYMRRKVDIRHAAKTVEAYWRGERIASHARSDRAGGCTTVREHMPKEHQEVLDWTPEQLRNQAQSIGLFSGRLIERVLESSRHPLQGARTSLGILRLGKIFGTDRLERACERALLIQALTYQSVHSILKKGLDRLPPPQPPPPAPSIQHSNIRGAQYYH
ncbi:MAG: IS21 family transposase [Candidatus Omnitrophota bacterium]